MEFLKTKLKMFLRWVFKDEIKDLEKTIQNLKDLGESVSKKDLNLHKSLEEALRKGKKLEELLGNLDISVDVHQDPWSQSWAVISLQGQKTDFIKFVDIPDRSIHEVANFLSKYDRGNIKMDIYPHQLKNQILKISKDEI